MKLYNTFLLKNYTKKKHMLYENDNKEGLVINHYWTIMEVIEQAYNTTNNGT